MDKKKQIGNSVLYILPILSSNVISLITLGLYTRILSREAFGVLALAQIYAVFVSGLANIALPSIYDRNFFEFQKTNEPSRLFYSTLSFSLASSALLILASWFLKDAISELFIGAVGYGRLVFWSLMAQSVIAFKSYFLIYLKNSENAKGYVVSTIVENILSVSIALFLVVYQKIGVIGIVYGLFWGNAIVVIFLSIRFMGLMTPAFDLKMLVYSIKLSLPATPSIFFGVIRTQFDKYMIGLLSTIGGVGIYSIGQKIAGICFAYTNALQNVFIPNVYKLMFQKKEDSATKIGLYLTPFFYFSICLSLFVALFAEELMTVLAPKSFHDAIPIIIVLSMFYGSLFFGKIPQLLYAKKTFLNSMLNILSIVLNILLNIPFILYWGAMGAAWATFVSGVVSTAVFFLISQKHYRINWEYGKIAMIYLVFIISSLLMILMTDASTQYMVRLCFKLVIVAGYLYIGNRLNIINIQNTKLLINTALEKVSREPAKNETI